MDRVTTVSYVLSTLVHGSLLVVVLWQAAVRPLDEPPELAEQPEQQEQAAEQQKMRPVPQRLPADQLVQALHDMSPPPLPELPDVAPQLAMQGDQLGKIFREADTQQSRGTGTEAPSLSGVALDLARRRAAGRQAGLLPNAEEQAERDRIENQRQREWERSSQYFSGLNRLRDTWLRHWQEHYGDRVTRLSLTLRVHIATDGTVTIKGFAAGGGTGVESLDLLILNHLKDKPRCVLQPNQVLLGDTSLRLRLE